MECESLWHLSEGDSESDMNKPNTKSSESADYLAELCHAADRRLYRLVKWCKSLPPVKVIKVRMRSNIGVSCHFFTEK